VTKLDQNLTLLDRSGRRYRKGMATIVAVIETGTQSYDNNRTNDQGENSSIPTERASYTDIFEYPKHDAHGTPASNATVRPAQI